MTRAFGIGLSLFLSVGLLGTALGAEPERDHGGERPAPHQAGPHQAEPRQAEAHPGPHGYQRITEPKGWNARPAATVDRHSYQHNFQAARSFKIGPYHRPAGWAPHRWVYGQTLPRTYWGSSYLLADYWLFALEVPPAGCEWVRDDADALLVDTNSGEILQVEYGVFG